MGRIQETWQEIKVFTDESLSVWGLPALIGLAVLTAFGLGRLSALAEAKPLVSITEAQTASAASTLRLGGYVVASRSGAVYYFPWCAGASNITLQNQRWFPTEEEAKKEGFRPAKNCRGLTE